MPGISPSANLPNAANSAGLRLAIAADIPRLVVLCRQSFPLSMRWQGHPTLGEQWWQAVLNSDAVLTLVYGDQTTADAFCVLITNMKRWRTQAAERRMRWLPLGFSCLRHSQLLGRRIWHFLAARLSVTTRMPVPTEQPAVTVAAWIELIAVDTGLRGRGIARLLLQTCETRTIAVGGQGLGLSVETSNIAATNLYQSMGYICLHASAKASFYVKSLVATKAADSIQATSDRL